MSATASSGEAFPTPFRPPFRLWFKAQKQGFSMGLRWENSWLLEARPACYAPAPRSPPEPNRCIPTAFPRILNVE